ncbi:MAG: hypothetical protein L7F77_13140 [Candidatus Magnetominusculus sp. LBB02]|nr:hypothetical protein [Candidatus Magnetominusculus sp. LBB02]MCG6553263.1 hypothetical protein [Candidatus Magnetominusculus sp. LBB02]
MRKYNLPAIVAQVVVMALLLSSLSAAAELRYFQLNDGSVITGEIVSYSNGVYTVKTAALGTITIKDSQVSSVSSRPASSGKGSGKSNSGQDVSSQVKALEQKAMSDDKIMAIITALATDPEFQAVIQDPAIMNAITNNDVNALSNNPKFTALLNHPKVREIEKRLGN